MPWIEADHDSIRVLVKNLSRDAVEGTVAVSGAAEHTMSLALGPYAEQIVELRAPELASPA
jgi:hypothetical protein